MNLVLNKQWEQIVSNLSNETLKSLDIELSDNSMLHNILCSSNTVLHLREDCILTNSDIKNVKLYSKYNK